MAEVRICRNYYPAISVSLEVGQKLLDEMAVLRWRLIDRGLKQNNQPRW
jgi:hypothetical protein